MRQVERAVGPGAHCAQRFLQTRREPARRARLAVHVDDARLHGQRLLARAQPEAGLDEEAIGAHAREQQVHAGVAREFGRHVVEVERGRPAAPAGRTVVDHLEDAASRRRVHLAPVRRRRHGPEDLRVERHRPCLRAILRLERDQRPRGIAQVHTRPVLSERGRRRRTALEIVVAHLAERPAVTVGHHVVAVHGA
jgi:hypothetical protein